MEHTCSKCGKTAEEVKVSVFGNEICLECWNQYLSTAEGKLELVVSLVNGDIQKDDNRIPEEEAFTRWVSDLWKRHKEHFSISAEEISRIETEAEQFGFNLKSE